MKKFLFKGHYEGQKFINAIKKKSKDGATYDILRSQRFLSTYFQERFTINSMHFPVPLQSLCASYMAGSVLVGHFMMLTIIFEVTFSMHGKLWNFQLFVYKIPFFLQLDNH